MGNTAKEKLISEREFIPVLNRLSRDFFGFINFLGARTREPIEWPKAYYSILADSTHYLESELDDYNARKNKDFSYFTELVASLKWFCYSASKQKHIHVRFSSYGIDISEEFKLEFLNESRVFLEYLSRSIRCLLDHLSREARKLGLDIPQDAKEDASAEDFHGIHEIRWLPNNIDEGEVFDQNHMVAEVASLFKKMADIFRNMHVNKEESIENIRSQILYDFDETKTRHLESLIHNIQSKYDTYIKGTSAESKHPALSYIRGHASVSLHLYEIATMLVHFYERYENDIRCEEAQKKVCRIIPQDDLLIQLNRYVRYYGKRFIMEGERHADKIIKTFLKLKTITIAYNRKSSLHARPLSLIAKIALHYNTPLEIEINGERCNASSIMKMIMMVGNMKDTEKFIFRGEDQALKDVKKLFDIEFFRDGDTSKVPPQLRYLLQ